MAEAKTKPTPISAKAFIAAIADEKRRNDCEALAALMTRITDCEAVMWGPTIIGFDQYHYKYASGREGDSCVVGFASGKSQISIYLLAGYESSETHALLQQLGKHKTGKACLYITRLADIKLEVLEKLIISSVQETRRRYPAIGKSN